MSNKITITISREELIEIIEKVAIREKFFIRNSVKLSIADAILSAGSQKKQEEPMIKYCCDGCSIRCQVDVPEICDCKPTACLYTNMAKYYEPNWKTAQV